RPSGRRARLREMARVSWATSGVRPRTCPTGRYCVWVDTSSGRLNLLLVEPSEGEPVSTHAASKFVAGGDVVVAVHDPVAVEIGPADHQGVAGVLDGIANQHHVLAVDDAIVIDIAGQHVEPARESGDKLIADRDRHAVRRVDRVGEGDGVVGPRTR